MREWQALRDAGYWSDVIAIRSAATPPHPDPGVRELVAGTERVDLGATLAGLARLAARGADVVRVDSGGALIGELLQARLVDEVSLLVHPHLTSSTQQRWYGAAATPRDLELVHLERVDRLVWLRYLVAY